MEQNFSVMKALGAISLLSILTVSIAINGFAENLTDFSYVPMNQAPHRNVVSDRWTRILEESDFYNFDLKNHPWEFKELSAPFLKNHAIFRFQINGLSEGTSVFVVVCNLASKDLRIIPLSDAGLSFGAKIEADPHNIAIYNEMMSSEPADARTDAQRLELGLLYLSLFSEKPEVLGRATAKNLFDKNPPRSTSEKHVPKVTSDSDGGFDVELVRRDGKDKCAKFMLAFDKSGML